MEIRQATLDDTRAISALVRGRIARWQRIDGRGRPEDVAYDALTIYERWLHGGPWMSMETGAIWLSHLLRGAGLPLVLTHDSAIIGYSELYPGDEPAPYGRHLHIGQRITAPDAPAEADDILMQHILEIGAAEGRVLANISAYDEAAAAIYRRYGFNLLTHIQQVTLPAQTGQGFYKATEQPALDRRRIAGWGQPVGRLASAREGWETLWPSHWDAVPQIVARKTYRQHINAAGQDAFVCLQQQLYDPRSADVYCWTPRPFTRQVLIAIRDWAHRQGYRTLKMAVRPDLVPLFGDEADLSPNQKTVYVRETA